MKSFFCLVSLWFSLLVSAQEKNKISATNQFSITGAIKQEKIVTIADLSQMPSQKIGNVLITNHLGVKKGVAEKLRGVLLKNVLESIVISEDSPKRLSEFYLTCIASDGYKVAFSWNELFNHASGNNIFIVTEKDGKPIRDMEEKVLLISPKDFNTGRRYVKGVQEIVINRVN